MGADGPFELLVVPQLLQEQAELIEEGVFEGVPEQEQLSEGFDCVEDLKDAVGVVSAFEVIDSYHARSVLLPIDVKSGLIPIQPGEVFLDERWPQIELDVIDSMRGDLVILGQAVYPGCR